MRASAMRSGGASAAYMSTSSATGELPGHRAGSTMVAVRAGYEDEDETQRTAQQARDEGIEGFQQLTGSAAPAE